MGRDGDVPLLHHAVGRVGDLVREHGVVLGLVAVQEIPSGWEKDGILKVLAVEPLVVDGSLRGGAGAQRIEQFGIVQEHLRLVLFGGDELIFNMLVLVGAIKMSDRLMRELMGLG